MLALLCSNNPILVDQVNRHLARRGLNVRQVPLGPLDASTVRPGEAFDLVIADLDLAEPELWRRGESLRRTFPYVPLIFLTHTWPGDTQIERFHPCAVVRKPLEIDLLAEALDGTHVALAQVADDSPETGRARL